MYGKLILALILAIALIIVMDANTNYPSGAPRGGTICHSDTDCPPQMVNYCDPNGAVCVATTTFRCEENGTNGTNMSVCKPAGSSLGCGPPCVYGCSNGACLPPPPPQGPDLIVSNISIPRVSESATMLVYIKNIGDADAGPSDTRVLTLSNGIVWILNTSAVPAGATVLAQPIEFAVPSGSSYRFNATADFFNQVAETNEGNNDLVQSFVFT